MISHQVSCWTTAALIGVAIGSPASAADCLGYDVLVTQIADTLDLGEGHTLTTVKWHSIVTTDNPSGVYNLTTGECSGAVLTTPDGKTRMGGFCVRRDNAGDTASIEWTWAPGAERGTWRATGGTGKFAGRNDSGWWQDAVADGKMSVSRFGGTCR